MTTTRPKHAPFGSLSLSREGSAHSSPSNSSGSVPTLTSSFSPDRPAESKFMRGHRHNFSNTVNNLLSRGGSQSKLTDTLKNSSSNAGQDRAHGHKRALSSDKISGPVFMRSDEPLAQRSGLLGSGATVVRTPNDALMGARVRMEHDEAGGERSPSLRHFPSAEEQQQRNQMVSPQHYPLPPSPPLPPLPLFEEPSEADEDAYLEEEEDEEEDKASIYSEVLPAPSSAPTSVHMSQRQATSTPPLRPSLKVKSMPLPTADDFPPVPPLPPRIYVPPTPLLPQFRAIITSTTNARRIDTSNLIIALETSTQTLKTTYSTLTSRPSLLSDFITALCAGVNAEPNTGDDDRDDSVYMEDNSDIDAYRYHLASQGLLSPTKSMKIPTTPPPQISLFLDRPSSPYPLVLDYLRSPSPPSSLMFPHGLSEALPSRTHHLPLDHLLDVRDEAAYLGLQTLRDLLIEEIRVRHVLGAPTKLTAALHHRRGRSTGRTEPSSHAPSAHASVYSHHSHSPSHSASSPALVLMAKSGSGSETPYSEGSTLNNGEGVQYHCGPSSDKHVSTGASSSHGGTSGGHRPAIRSPSTPNWDHKRTRSRDPPPGWI